jgi:glycosyltransferase involved in cell wall biosynthesis
MTVFETHRLPHWIGRELNERVPAMIVPSKFNTEGLRACGYTRPVFEIPHTVGEAWWRDAPAPEANRPFTFTYSGAWVPRKNPMAVIRAYLDAFPEPRADVLLQIKTANTYGRIDKATALVKGRPDVWIWDEMWTDRQMQWLLANTDCFVSAHYSEGWGLGPFQAKLLEKPVIYTDWSAVKEFCSEANGDIPIPYRMGPVMKHMRKSGMAIYQEKEGNLHWAYPKHEALVEAMRTMVQKPLGFAERAKAVAPMLRERFGWPTVGKQFLEVIKQLPV